MMMMNLTGVLGIAIVGVSLLSRRRPETPAAVVAAPDDAANSSVTLKAELARLEAAELELGSAEESAREKWASLVAEADAASSAGDVDLSLVLDLKAVRAKKLAEKPAADRVDVAKQAAKIREQIAALDAAALRERREAARADCERLEQEAFGAFVEYAQALRLREAAIAAFAREFDGDRDAARAVSKLMDARYERRIKIPPELVTCRNCLP